MLTQGFQKFYGSHGSPENHFSKTWRSLLPNCFLLKQPNFQNVLEGPRFENCLLHPYLDKFTPTPFLCFWLFSFRNLTKLYGFRNDIHFLSGMLRNFTDYATMLFLTSGMLQNVTDCATMFPFDFRHVAELHRLPNDGCYVPWVLSDIFFLSNKRIP